MKHAFLALTAVLAVFASAVQTSNAQCPAVSVANNGPCTIVISLQTNLGAAAFYTIPAGAGFFIPAPAGHQWALLVSVSTVSPCIGVWTQAVNLPLGGAVIVQAPLPFPYNRAVVNGCHISLN